MGGRSRPPRLQHRHGKYVARAQEVENGAPLCERPRHDLVSPEVGEVPCGVPCLAGCRHQVEAEVRVHRHRRQRDRDEHPPRCTTVHVIREGFSEASCTVQYGNGGDG